MYRLNFKVPLNFLENIIIIIFVSVINFRITKVYMKCNSYVIIVEAVFKKNKK